MEHKIFFYVITLTNPVPVEFGLFLNLFAIIHEVANIFEAKFLCTSRIISFNVGQGCAAL